MATWVKEDMLDLSVTGCNRRTYRWSWWANFTSQSRRSNLACLTLWSWRAKITSGATGAPCTLQSHRAFEPVTSRRSWFTFLSSRAPTSCGEMDCQDESWQQRVLLAELDGIDGFIHGKGIEECTRTSCWPCRTSVALGTSHLFH